MAHSRSSLHPQRPSPVQSHCPNRAHRRNGNGLRLRRGYSTLYATDVFGTKNGRLGRIGGVEMGRINRSRTSGSQRSLSTPVGVFLFFLLIVDHKANASNVLPQMLTTTPPKPHAMSEKRGWRRTSVKGSRTSLVLNRTRRISARRTSAKRSRQRASAPPAWAGSTRSSKARKKCKA